MMIQEANGIFVISSGGVWRPGAYETERAARYAFRLTDEQLSKLQQAANVAAGGAGGVVTYEQLRAEHKTRKSPDQS